ncbi:M15 family metallopeptidase [Francisella frigiditurris]|uniref:D-alanyl-D-alanine dipeptidase n=1 Tax=Francisella frigiditurris TaxID=1542390 RepID=A0A1J0KSG4_9GAMM|nr:M15 family metallopeptidase [Francisella frigiditurris]APC96689.1 D-ala-D-ala dipeptidase family protein [Francisella frigiditurris]
MFKKVFILLSSLISIQFAFSQNIPDDFVNVQEVIPSIQVDMRYASDFNFVGKKIDGYNEGKCYLTDQAAEALSQVQDKLVPMGLSLKVYDCYRPQKAVDNFVKWAADTKATQMKPTFYEEVDKKNLFKDGYIAAKSGHSRGSTMDLTIVPIDSKTPEHRSKQVSCTAPYSQRDPDNSLDFGTGFDCFSEKSHPDYVDIPAQARANRLLLQRLMEDAGFVPLDTEWWHFTLKDEPYKDTYFNFDV